MRSWVFVPKQGNLSCPGTWRSCCFSFISTGYFPKVKRFKVLNQYVFTRQDAWQTNCVYTLLDAVAVSSFSILSPNIGIFLKYLYRCPFFQEHIFVSVRGFCAVRNWPKSPPLLSHARCHWIMIEKPIWYTSLAGTDFESPKSGDRFGRKNRRAGIELFCFNFYSPLHLTVQCIWSVWCL